MQTHTVLGEQMLGGVSFLRGECMAIVRSHHERWDGDGYPDGLDKDDIPLGARIFAVADALDAITSDRPYREAQSWKFARDEITAGSGAQFDPLVVDAFLGARRAAARDPPPARRLDSLGGLRARPGPAGDPSAGRGTSRASRSSDSPRSNRSTTPSLRRALQRTSLLASGSSLRAPERNPLPASIPASPTLDIPTSTV